MNKKSCLKVSTLTAGKLALTDVSYFTAGSNFPAGSYFTDGCNFTTGGNCTVTANLTELFHVKHPW